MVNDDLSRILSPPLKRSLADEIVDRLRQAILDGRLAPGEPLREELLAESMAVSRGPIRVALSQLEREGLVLMRRNRTALVARLSVADLDEVFSLRMVLERLAVQYAIRQPDPAAWAELQETNDTMSTYTTRGITEREAADLDTRFHDILCRTSKHQRLYSCWSNLRPQIYIFLLSRNVANPDFRQNVVSGHQGILDAIRSQDESLAVRRIEEHLKAGYDRVVSSYHAHVIGKSNPPALKPERV